MSLAEKYKRSYTSLAVWGNKAHGVEDAPAFNAILGLSTVATLNLFSLAMLIEFAIGQRGIIPNARIIAPLVWIGLVGLHYLTLRPSADANSIPPSSESHGRALLLTVIYMIGSLVLFLTLVAIRGRVE